MPGLGTIINAAAIIVAGLLGLLFGRFLTSRIQDILVKACGLGCLVIGFSGALKALWTVSDESTWRSGTLMMIVALCLGGLIGELLGIERGLEKLGTWLREKSGSSGDSRFLDGFITASLILPVGAMAVIGPMNDALYGDYTILIAKSIMDASIVFALAATYGKGTIFSVLPVVAVQGLFTALAFLIAPIMTGASLNNLSIVGSTLIVGIGLNLIFEKTFHLANYLPALVIAVLWGLFIG